MPFNPDLHKIHYRLKKEGKLYKLAFLKNYI